MLLASPHPSRCHVQAAGGRERYVFFSFPHIGTDTDGSLGKVRRPGRDGNSAACGALVAALGELQGGGLKKFMVKDGGEQASVHEVQ